MLRPYVSERTYWIVLHHGLFQSYYYAHHTGGDRNARDAYRDHPWYQDTAEFCHRWDGHLHNPPTMPMTGDHGVLCNAKGAAQL